MTERRSPRWLPARNRGTACMLALIWTFVASVQGVRLLLSLTHGDDVLWLDWVVLALPLVLTVWYWATFVYLSLRPERSPDAVAGPTSDAV